MFWNFWNITTFFAIHEFLKPCAFIRTWLNSIYTQQLHIYSLFASGYLQENNLTYVYYPTPVPDRTPCIMTPILTLYDRLPGEKSKMGNTWPILIYEFDSDAFLLAAMVWRVHSILRPNSTPPPHEISTGWFTFAELFFAVPVNMTSLTAPLGLDPLVYIAANPEILLRFRSQRSKCARLIHYG